MAIIKIPEYDNIYVHSQVPVEMAKITKGWGGAKKFEKWFEDRLT